MSPLTPIQRQINDNPSQIVLNPLIVQFAFAIAVGQLGNLRKLPADIQVHGELQLRVPQPIVAAKSLASFSESGCFRGIYCSSRCGIWFLALQGFFNTDQIFWWWMLVAGTLAFRYEISWASDSELGPYPSRVTQQHGEPLVGNLWSFY
jgi:hypothetical protein